jgi:hypothetical protein
MMRRNRLQNKQRFSFRGFLCPPINGIAVAMFAFALSLIGCQTGTTKVYQQAPYLIAGWAGPEPLTVEDIRALEVLVAHHRHVAKPILRIYIGSNGYIEVVTGHEGHRGDFTTHFLAQKRKGRWIVTTPIYDSRENIFTKGT